MNMINNTVMLKSNFIFPFQFHSTDFYAGKNQAQQVSSSDQTYLLIFNFRFNF